MNKFPVLSFVSNMLKLFGWLSVIIGLIAFVGPFIGLGFTRDLGIGGPIVALVGLLMVGYGFGTIAIGESVGVLFAIEENTRDTTQAIATQATLTRSKLVSIKHAPPSDVLKGDGTPV